MNITVRIDRGWLSIAANASYFLSLRGLPRPTPSTGFSLTIAFVRDDLQCPRSHCPDDLMRSVGSSNPRSFLEVRAEMECRASFRVAACRRRRGSRAR